MAIGDSGLQYDNQGFLIGAVQQKVETIDKNILEILKLLRHDTVEQTQRFKISRLQRAMYEANSAKNIEDIIKDATQILENQSKQQIKAISNMDSSKSDQIDPVRNNTNQTKPVESTRDNTQQSDRKRDSNGRFVAGDVPESDETVDKRNRDDKGRFVPGTSTTISKFGDIVGKFGQAVSGLGTDAQGFDPTVDAINELGTVLSPVKRMAGIVFKPLTGLAKMRKRSEPLPKEQTDHNKKQLKILQRIADRTGNNQGGLLSKLLGSGGGLLGGLLGKGGKVLSKILKFGKGLPIVGGLLSAISLMDWGDKSTEQKGGAIGSIGGGVVGGVLGSVLGPAGTIVGAGVGAWIGDKLGTTVAPYFKNWTDSLIKSDLGQKIVSIWDGFVDTISGWFDKAWGGLKSGAGAIGGMFNGAWQTVKNIGNKGLDTIGFNDYKALEGGNAQEKTMALLRQHEGFREKAYWDVNAYRTGYGSDTVTDKNGNVRKVTSNTKVSREDAERDLLRRSKIFAAQARRKVGGENWDKLPDDAKAALTSVAYNYGSLPKSVTKAVQTGDLKRISNSVQSLGAHNKGINRKRRNHESLLIHNAKDSSVSTSQVQHGLLASTNKTNTPFVAKADTMLATANPVNLNNHTAKANTPKIETAKTRLNSTDPQKVLVVNQSDGSITQNLGDRALAHAITGGIGER
ncbi:hypothetical protein GCM10023206_07130 [Acinetobacter puyangensis]|uniref:Lysozyme n=1 Tax=Acinetobacter puyangensis TaxID=1096779 RepID=A0A240E625_9GAMM|nr:hypothetical protein [Acinetobacter puyangensis]SNX44207.1 hypothetical protein SAMN05421731_102368 [Acinetobacter puyangensis]